MRRSSVRFSLISAFALVALLGASTMKSVTAQAPAPQSDETTRALISELRQLRIAIENLTSSNSRVSILAMRANQHEQRLSSLSSQLLTMKSNLLDISAETSHHESILLNIQERLRVESDPQRRRQLEVEHREIATSMSTMKLKQAVLQNEVNQLEQQTRTEQSRLTEIQQRLDDEERVLREPRQNR